ncbi:hypothetical protein L7F22_020778 [Adiantum nelumboides]|nr:hypothetical protein [Adiantum nelumboides]
MKFSVKFREDKSPLLRAKVPFKLGPIPLSSGVAIGTKQDLALHFATGFSCGPVIKLAFKPHHTNPVSLLLKSGLGLLGSPGDAPFILTAELRLTPKVQDCLVSVRIKPRFGDFSIRKDVKNVSLLPLQQKELARTFVRMGLHENGEDNHVITPEKSENGCISSSLSNGEVKAVSLQMSGNSLDKEQVPRSTMDPGNVVVGSNFSLRVEGLENGPHDRKSRLDRVEEADGEAGICTPNRSMILHAPNDRFHEHVNKNSGKSSASFSLGSAYDALRGCRIVTQSSLPLGNQSRLNVRWGVKAASDVFQGWDGSLPSLSFLKLLSLVLEKISFEQVVSHVERHRSRGSSELGLLPATFIEENRELAQVAGLCYTMKRQLHLMHAENQVLRRAMEDMKAHVDLKGSSWIRDGVADGMPKDNHLMPRQPCKSSTGDASPPSWFGEKASERNVHAPRVKKAASKKDKLLSNSSPVESNGDNVSKELEKAILSAQTGLVVGKKERST